MGEKYKIKVVENIKKVIKGGNYFPFESNKKNILTDKV